MFKGGRAANYQLHVYLSAREHQRLMQQVRVTGFSRSALVRALIMQANIRPRPPDELPALLRDLSGMANNLNQIARIANSKRDISDANIKWAVSLAQAAWQLVKDTL